MLEDERYAGLLIEQAMAIHEKGSNRGEHDKLRSKLRDFERQNEALAEHLTKIPKGLDPSPIFSQMQVVSKRVQETHEELEALEGEGLSIDPPVGFKTYQDYVRTLREAFKSMESIEAKTCIVAALVERVEVFPDRFVIHYKIGLTSILDANDLLRKAVQKTEKPLEGVPLAAFQSIKFSGSNTLTNGRRGRI